MSFAYHVCWGDSARGCLKERNRQLNISNPVVAVLDNFRIGPLIDADLAMPKRRHELFIEICEAQWWYNSTEYKSALLQYQLESHLRLLDVLTKAAPVIAWVGNNACDKLMMAMIAHLITPSTPLAMVDISGQVEFNHNGEFALGYCTPESLLQLSPIEISPMVRKELAEKWIYWRGHAQGWREIGDNGDILEYPIDYLDHLLLAKIEHMKPRLAIDIMDDIAREAAGIIPVDLLYWRLNILRKNGDVVFTQIEGQPPHSPHVVKSGVGL
ncbi:DUF1835 domain-containing protein [Aeromonas dhakensis]|uniref:DUF1835 domain-containing protein n=1 Tax=Aeromonas dhakensis TaxID=196024 RepID=UPI00280E0F55|nr:DUF1835 domain-containing protein [Aeromonas hydrophila]